MKGKCLVVFGCSLLLALATAGSAWAVVCSAVSGSATLCQNAGGQFLGTPPNTSCVIVTPGERIDTVHPACVSAADFTAVYNVVTSTTYAGSGTNCTTTIASTETLNDCKNPQGVSIGTLRPCLCGTD